jgi:hypothetical protein
LSYKNAGRDQILFLWRAELFLPGMYNTITHPSYVCEVLYLGFEKNFSVGNLSSVTMKMSGEEFSQYHVEFACEVILNR